MKLESLAIRGFKTFSNATLEVSKLTPGVVFVRGNNLSEPELESNGSGKSSLFGALFWALFGKTVDGLRNTDVKPWALKGKTQVDVRLDGSTVSRSVGPNRTLINGTDAGPEQIEKLLGFGFDLASHAILMGQGRPLFLDLAPAKKLELLSEALDLDRWEERSRKAAERLSELDSALGSLDTQETHGRASLAELEAMLERVQEQAREWDQLEQVNLASVEMAINSKTEQLGRHQDAYAKADLAYDGAQTELRALSTQIRELNQEEAMAALTVSNRNRLLQEIKTMEQTKTCPTCGQPVSNKNVSEHRAEIKRQLEAMPAEEEVLLADIKKQIKTLIASETKFQAKSNRALDAKVQVQAIVAKLEAEIGVLKESLTRQRGTLNPFQEQITDLNKRRGKILSELKTLAKEMDKIRKQWDQVRFWIKGFKEVRLFILEEILQEMELITNASLEEVGLVGWEVHYEVERETKAGTTVRGLNVWVQSPTNDKPVRWECWSGGESQRLKIIGSAALNDVLLAQVGVNCNFEIWDESGSFLSEGGVEDFIEFLANRAEDQGKVIFMVDHMARQSARFTSTITVTKKNGVSTISCS
jgi:DNA repair exonuclease SbcCD ATPase subunit